MSQGKGEIDLGDGRVVVMPPAPGERPAAAPPGWISWSFGGPRQPPAAPAKPATPWRRWRLPILLFGLTAASTWLVGGTAYALGIMSILLCHELGHFLQSRRYRVPATPPYFIPMPLTPLGTLGAVIGMQPRVATARQLFDIAITGPLAGLLPTLICLLIGLPQSQVVPAAGADGSALILGEPLALQWLVHYFFELGPDQTLAIGGLAMAGWAGLLLTSLNLLPIGQLDGGHLVFTLLPRRAYQISVAVLLVGILASLASGYWGWSLMILLLLAFGVRHPPVAQDPEDFDLGKGRKVLGWLTLILCLSLGFTPMPLQPL